MLENLPKENMSQSTRRLRGSALQQLKHQIVDAALQRLRAPESIDVREAARVCGLEVSSNLNHYWRKSAECPEGVIDVVDMFSGCGGMSAGFKAVNGLLNAFRIACAVDVDEVANGSYKDNLCVTPIAQSIGVIARSPIQLKRISQSIRQNRPWVLIGCAPCQGFSSHRNSSGATDPRNSLFVDFARIAARLNPDAVVVENVPELLTYSYWPHVQEATSVLEKAGYCVHIAVHNMAEFGVPQERFRTLILAMKRNFLPPRPFLQRSQFRTVRDAIASLPRIAAGQRCSVDGMHYTAGHQPSTLETIRAVPKNGGNRPPGVGPACLRRAELRQGKAAYEDVYGRLHWDRPAITITAYARNPASGRFIHPEQDRGLSIREASLLQGFPADYSFRGSLDERFRQIGNAVPPQFAAFIACHILGELLGAPLKESHVDHSIRQPVGHSFSRIIPSLKASGTSSFGAEARQMAIFKA